MDAMLTDTVREVVSHDGRQGLARLVRTDCTIDRLRAAHAARRRAVEAGPHGDAIDGGPVGRAAPLLRSEFARCTRTVRTTGVEAQ